jgi:hypothetical protein
MDYQLWYDPNGDWAALYADGNLDAAGAAETVEERVFELFGVTVKVDNAFLLPGGKGAANTLDEIKHYKAEAEGRLKTAIELRRKAKLLITQAEKLEA